VVVGAHIESWAVLRCLNSLVCSHVSLSCRRNCVVHKCVSYNNPVVRRVVSLLKVGVKLKFYLFRVGGLCTVAGCVAKSVGSSLLYKQRRILSAMRASLGVSRTLPMELIMIANCL